MDRHNTREIVLDHMMNELDTISDEICRCIDCDLYKDRKQAVAGQYTKRALEQRIKIVFLGEGPGAMEDETGQVFIGKSGEELNNLLEQIGLSRHDVFILNTVKCRPPKNRTPTHHEMFMCAYHLYRQIAIICPDLIVAMGASAIYNIIQPKNVDFTPMRKHKIMKVMEARHKVYDFNGPPIDGIPGWTCKAIATYHPAALLRSNTTRKETIRDFAMIKKYIEILKQKKDGLYLN